MVLGKKDWSELVDRLNESSKRKEVRLMKVQHRKLAEELEGLNFKPQINHYPIRAPRKPLYPGPGYKRCAWAADGARSLAGSVSAPFPALFRPLNPSPRGACRGQDSAKRKQDQVAREMAEATFQPDLSLTSRFDKGRRSEEALRRRVSHLQRYVR